MSAHPSVSFEDTSIAFASKTDFELTKMYVLFAAMNNSLLVKKGMKLLNFALKIHLPVKFVIKPTIFDHFCGGETIEECEQAIKELADYHIGTILDYSVEGEKSETGFDQTVNEICATIKKASNSASIPFSVFKITGIADAALLTKVQAGTVLTETEKNLYEKAFNRVDEICRFAAEHNVRVFIDAEESWIQAVIDEMADTMMERYNQNAFIVYNTYQFYRHDRLLVLQKAHERAIEKNYKIGAKLVRGAYMEKERSIAQQQQQPSPINASKAATDQLFNEALRFCVLHLDRIAICAGTHNEESSYLLIKLMEEQHIKPSDDRIYFAQLFGMSDNISYNLAKAGYNVAKYVPYGPVESVMPYLIRRANENTAIAGQSSREFNLIKKERRRRATASR